MAHIALTAYELETGGISRVAIYLANGFAAAGHRVSLVLCSDKGELHGALSGELADTVETVVLGQLRLRSRALGEVATWPALRRWLQQERPDVLLGTSNNISWFTGLAVASLRLGRPALYLKTTNPILRKADGPIITALRRWGYGWIFSLACAVLTLSEAENRLLSAQFPALAGQFLAVFSPYLTPSFLASRVYGPRRQNAGPLLLAMGRLSAQKNFARAIYAFSLMREAAKGAPDHPLAGAHLLIAGEGPEREELEELIVRLGLSDSVSLPGFSNDAPTLFARADRFLLSSNYEGLPAVVIEALGSCCPVVATDCFPAAREKLEGLPGCRVSELSAAALSEVVIGSFADHAPREALRLVADDYQLPNAVASHLRAMKLA